MFSSQGEGRTRMLRRALVRARRGYSAGMKPVTPHGNRLRERREYLVRAMVKRERGAPMRWDSSVAMMPIGRITALASARAKDVGGVRRKPEPG